MEEIRNVIDNKLRNIKHATIPYNEKWKTKKGDSIPVVTYSFPQSIPSNYYYYELNHKIPISSLNQLQIDQAKSTFRNISDVTNISFTEVKYTEVNISIVNFHSKNPMHISGYAYFPNSGNFSPICINADHSKNLAPTYLNSGGHVIVHEILHAVGLKHTHDTAGLTQRESVMSYFSEQYSGANYGGHHVSTPQLYDIAALQYLYGANMHTRSGNTTYGFNSNSGRKHFSARNSNDPLIFCVWDAGGIDTFDFSEYTQNQMINLNQGSFSNVGGLTGNISIAFNVTIENTIGGKGNDILIGNQENNTLKGGSGDDQLDGGIGADHLWGGKGRDIFRYSDINDSTLNAADTIYDFQSGQDKIDLSSLANGNIILTDGFRSTDHHRGRTEVAQFYGETSDLTYLMINFDHTDQTDMVIKLAGKHQLTAHDFICAPLLTA
ncbi:M57 family metalloprotease [Yersinia enterocolitica]|uniref:M10 family metallopeptidase C-terminal domain-containing protein n=1 Tax=Yersinia enterocolitica TaxID=630 RepID=UPI0030CCD243